MMNRIPLRVFYSDGTTEPALCNGNDSVKFERTYQLHINQLGARLEYAFYLAWAALSRTGKTTLDFDEWLKMVDMVADDEEAEGQKEIRPLEKDPPTSPSPTSPSSSDSLLL